MKTLSKNAILDFFLKHEVMIIRGSKVCKKHLTKRNLLRDDYPEPTFDYVEMTVQEVEDFVGCLRTEINKQKKRGLNIYFQSFP